MNEPEPGRSRLDEEETGSVAETMESEERRSNERRDPVKVVDRRFWAKQTEAGSREPSGGERSTYPKFVEELQSQLEEARARLHDLTAAYRRVQEEGEEVRSRLNRDLDRRVTAAKAELFRELLDVADNLERALGAASSAAEAGSLERGVAQVLSSLRRLLEAQGVEGLEVIGQPFDPAVAEAMEVRGVDDPGGDGAVIEVLQRGYRYCGRTLRAARVVVGKAGSPPTASQQSGGTPDGE